MDSVLYYRAMEAFSRQRAKMDGESEIFWLAEAEVLSKLGADAHKLKTLFPIPSSDGQSIYATGRPALRERMTDCEWSADQKSVRRGSCRYSNASAHTAS
jgi:hypothetical protein